MNDRTASPDDQPFAPPRPLPGDRTMQAEINRMVRVDHAGEFGAVRIYKGQLAVLGDRHPKSAMIRHMLAQEEVHLDRFNKLIAERGVRPTVLAPFWDVAGFALGAATALMGERAAMACTAAVEEVIDDHYQHQRDRLTETGADPDFEQTIAQFQAEEVEHRDTAIEHGAKETPGYGLLSGTIKAGCRAAIWLAKRV